MSHRRSFHIAKLLTLLLCSATAPVYAESAASPDAVVAPGSAATASDPTAPDTTIVVTGHTTRLTNTLKSEDILRGVPGNTPLKAVGNLPGVAFISSDPGGLDLYSQSFSSRGFSQDRLGFTLDGLPLGGQGYNPYNGVPVNRVISNENIGSITVSPGAGGVGVASENNLGGAIEFAIKSPDRQFGAQISQTAGSSNAFRTFVRINSGDLNSSGSRFFVSYERNANEKWTGAGDQFLQMVNAKAVQPLSPATNLEGFFSWSQEETHSYLLNSLESIRKIGAADYLYPDYAASYQAALGNYPARYLSLSSPKGYTTFDGAEPSHDYFGSVTLNSQLGSSVKLKVAGYTNIKRFDPTLATPFIKSPNGAPMALQDRHTKVRRYGLTSDLTWETNRNSLNAGVWYERRLFDYQRRLFQEPLLGQGAPLDPFDVADLTPFSVAEGLYYRTNVFKFHLQDTYDLSDHLHVHAGFAALYDRTFDTITANDPKYSGVASIPSGALTSSDPFLPQVGINWQPGKGHELFGDISRNMTAYQEGPFGNGHPWGVTTQAAFDELKQNLQPEKDWVFETGYRYHNTAIQGQVSLYYTRFSNRQQAIIQGSAIQTRSLFANVGNVNMKGVDASLTLTPLTGLHIYNSVSYNRSDIRNDVTSAGVLYLLKGNMLPNYPKWMFKNNLSYDVGALNFHSDVSYMSKRFISYSNDTYAPGYWLADLGVSLDVKKIGGPLNASISIDIYNLTDKQYISNIGVAGNPFVGDAQSLQLGSPRQFFVTLKARI